MSSLTVVQNVPQSAEGPPDILSGTPERIFVITVYCSLSLLMLHLGSHQFYPMETNANSSLLNLECGISTMSFFGVRFSMYGYVYNF